MRVGWQTIQLQAELETLQLYSLPSDTEEAVDKGNDR